MTFVFFVALWKANDHWCLLLKKRRKIKEVRLKLMMPETLLRTHVEGPDSLFTFDKLFPIAQVFLKK